MADARKISKSLSYWLRHRPEAAQLKLHAAGWAPVTDVLRALAAAGLADRRERLESVVARSDKNRFELSADGLHIRARQGHSVAVDLDWPAAEPPQFLFHGTVERNLDSIMAEGLKAMKRHHVHLSPDIETAEIVGRRRGPPVVLRIEAAKMAADGHVFRLSGNGVWLTDPVPAGYIGRVSEGVGR